MSFKDQELVDRIIKSNKMLFLSTSINGLPTGTMIPYKHVPNKDGIENIYFKISKKDIAYNQLLFNKNSSIFIGNENNNIKAFGKAVIIEENEINKIYDVKDENYGYFFFKFETILLDQKEILIKTSNKFLLVNKDQIFSNFLSEIKFWLRMTRAAFFTATIIPILLGIVLAWVLTGSFEAVFALLTLLAGIFIHSGTNLINDFYDQRSDDVNNNFTSFNGGSRIIQIRLATQEKILFSAVTSFLIGIFIILGLVYRLQSAELLFLLITGVFLAFFYSAKPLQLSHHGLGEISNFLGYGPILTVSSWLIQTKGNYTVNQLAIVLYWSIIPGLLLVLILIINEFQDFDSDKQSGKKTILVRIGKQKGKYLYNGVSVITYGLILVGVLLLDTKNIFGIISMVGLLLFYTASKVLNKYKDTIIDLLPANALTVENHLLTNILLMAGFILSKLFFS